MTEDTAEALCLLIAILVAGITVIVLEREENK